MENKNEINIANNKINMTLGGEPATQFMQALIDFFEQNGGENFLTLSVGNGEKKYSITVENCKDIDTSAKKLQRYEESLLAIENLVFQNNKIPVDIRSEIQKLIICNAKVTPKSKKNENG